MSRDLYYGSDGAQMGVPAEIVIFRYSGVDLGRYVISLQVPRSTEPLYGKVWGPNETYRYAVVDDFGDLVGVPA